jgi:hypothetical protein
MAVGVLQEIPFVTQEMYDAVNQEMDTRNNPPAGLIVHTGGPMEGGGFRIFDAWESEGDWEQFRQNTLAPAIAKVSGGQAPPAPPRIEVYELQDVIKP